MLTKRLQPWRREAQPRVCGKPGAVQWRGSGRYEGDALRRPPKCKPGRGPDGPTVVNVIPLRDQFSRIRLVANEAMRQAHLTHPLPSPAGEVACIRHLANHALPRIDSAWRNAFALSGVHVTMQSVICHGRPYVAYLGAVRGCELGDLLLVHEHYSPGRRSQRAALVQAKLFRGGRVTAPNDVQKTLYRTWPPFVYTSWPGGLGKLRQLAAQRFAGAGSGFLIRDLRSGPGGAKIATYLAEDGSRYGLIDDMTPWQIYNAWCGSPWRMCSARVPDLYRYGGGLSLGGYLTRLLFGHVGRPFQRLAWPVDLATTCHWSIVMHELLTLLPPAGSGSLPGPALAFATMSGGGGAETGDRSPEDEDGAFLVVRISTRGGLGLGEDTAEG